MQAPTSNSMNSSACSCGVRIVDLQPIGKGTAGFEVSFPFWVDTVFLTWKSTNPTRPHWLGAVGSTGVSNVRSFGIVGCGSLTTSHASVGDATAATEDS